MIDCSRTGHNLNSLQDSMLIPTFFWKFPRLITRPHPRGPANIMAGAIPAPTDEREIVMPTRYTYGEALAASQKVNWKVEDVIGGKRKLDFSKLFLPDTLARTRHLACLSEDECLRLNQIRGHGYLYTFELVEEFILPFVLDRASHNLHGKAEAEAERVQALLQFAGEEAKHIRLFKRFRDEFVKGFGSECAVIGPPEEIASAVLAHAPLSVALVTLHIEWMTQAHYVGSIKDDQNLDPQFKSLLRHHWMEECQHTKLDTLIVEAMAEGMTEDEISRAVDGYLEIGMLLDKGLMQQVQFDIKALEDAVGRTLTEREKQEIQSVQEQAVRWTYLGSGMSHPRFLGTVETVKPGARAVIEQVAPAFS